MEVEKVSAGPAMQRPQPVTKAVQSNEVRTASEDQMAVGGAPGFDHASGTVIAPRAGMLANPVMQKFTSPTAEPTGGQPEVKNVDSGAINIQGDKKPARKSPAPRKSQKRTQKRG
jgi:hypothetical protein